MFTNLPSGCMNVPAIYVLLSLAHSQFSHADSAYLLENSQSIDSLTMKLTDS
jgi:hypothetical protein